MPTHAELAKVHIAKRDLKLSDPLYRGFINVLFGETSARDLSHEQIEELLQHFKSLGWENEYSPSTDGVGRGQSERTPPSRGSGPATMAQIGLIVYLWQHGPGIRHKSMQALDHFLNHHFHIQNLKQVKARQVPGVLGAIKNMGKM
ncbi:MAG: regulatory protein GemA [Nitrospina sp.]|nr:regulatory protein GemA [Nitrospina sp.]